MAFTGEESETEAGLDHHHDTTDSDIHSDDDLPLPDHSHQALHETGSQCHPGAHETETGSQFHQGDLLVTGCLLLLLLWQWHNIIYL